MQQLSYDYSSCIKKGVLMMFLLLLRGNLLYLVHILIFLVIVISKLCYLCGLCFRYELPQPAAGKMTDLAAWTECVENSMAQLEHQATRYICLPFFFFCVKPIEFLN